jgi:hypothetical protein
MGPVNVPQTHTGHLALTEQRQIRLRYTFLSRSSAVAAKKAMGVSKNLLELIVVDEMRYHKALRETGLSYTAQEMKVDFAEAAAGLEQACRAEGFPSLLPLNGLESTRRTPPQDLAVQRSPNRTWITGRPECPLDDRDAV